VLEKLPFISAGDANWKLRCRYQKNVPLKKIYIPIKGGLDPNKKNYLLGDE
jgi:hypothetical protein